MTRPTTVDAVLREYRAQVLRWNRQISLISRKDPEGTLDRLLLQSREGLTLLVREGLVPPGIAFFDLGSGGGLPGVVWHLLMNERGLAPRTCLVEPREKRAWFLDRLRGLAGMPDFKVAPVRWGEADLEGFAPADVIISLKALNLSDPEILGGLTGSRVWGRIVIARYYPPAEPWTSDLAARLGIPAAGSEVASRGRPWLAEGARVLSGGDFSLVVSTYEAPSS